jgi:hypothetical protein
MDNKYIFLQILGFMILIALLWRFGGPELAAITATMVAIWEFIDPSRKR